MWLDSHVRFLAVRLWTKLLVAPEYSLCSCSLADSFFLSLEDPCCEFHFEQYFFRVDFTPSSGRLAAEGATGGSEAAWHMGSARFLSRPLPSSFSLALLELAIQPLSLPRHCFRPEEWGRYYLGDGSGRTGYLTLRVFGANNTRIVSQIESLRAEEKRVRSLVWTGSLWLGRFCHMTML